MIQKILIWLREAISKMITTTNVKQAMNVNVAISELMVTALNKWSRMYQNKSPWLNDQIFSLNLAAAISSEIARAVTIEMVVELSGSSRADFLNEQMEYVVKCIREQIEYGCAKGGLMFKPYLVQSEGKVAVDYIQADQFYPISFDSNKHVMAAIFQDQRTIGQWVYTRLEYHRFVNSQYVITNAVFRSASKEDLGTRVSFSFVPEWTDLAEEAVINGITKPLFAYFRYPMANNIDVTSPLGVSCFSRAVTLIEQADKLWSNFIWELDSAQRAMYVDTTAFGKDSNGKPMLPNKRLYRTLDSTGNLDTKNKLFEDWTPTIRQADMLASLDAHLKQIEFLCGLAQGTISDPNTIALTATEIKMSKQRTYATITDTQKVVKDTLEDLLYAMDFWATVGALSPNGKYEAVYSFDDSIVADHDTQFSQDMQVVTGQMMPKVEFLMRNYGLTEEIAKKWIADVVAAQPADMFSNPDLNGA